MNTLLSTIKKTSLFSTISDNTIENYIIPKSVTTHYSEGETIFSAQQKIERIYILLEGEINTYHILSDGVCNLISKRHAVTTFGTNVVCTQSKISPYHVVAASPSTIFSFPVKLILKQNHLPEDERLLLLNQLLLIISQDNMKREYHLAILTHNSLRERIVVYLTMQASKRQKNTFEIPFNREELAMFLCVNRSALSHELSLMKKEGLIDFHKNKFRLLKLDPVNQKYL